MGVVETAYKDLFAVCGSIQPNCKIFIHSYDFARPTGVGVCPDIITGGSLVGPWLKPSLDYRGWTNFISASGVVATVLKQFDTLMGNLEKQYSPQVVYVRTQGTLVPQIPLPIQHPIGQMNFIRQNPDLKRSLKNFWIQCDHCSLVEFN
jgi:hypothetical protein